MQKLLIYFLLIANLNFIYADEQKIEKPNQTDKQIEKTEELETKIKEKFHLSEEALEGLKSQGFHGPQLAIIAGIAEKSGKTPQYIAKMRVEQKMGWGQITKELGLPASTIGQSVAELHRQNKRSKKNENSEKRHSSRSERHEHKNEKHEKSKRGR